MTIGCALQVSIQFKRGRRGPLVASSSCAEFRFSNATDLSVHVDVLGPRLQFLTALSDDDHDYCLNKGSVPPGVVVPLHSHPEREKFYVLEGEVEGLWKDRWITLGGGDPFDVPGVSSTAGESIQRVGVDAGGGICAVGPILSRYWSTGSDCRAGCAETR